MGGKKKKEGAKGGKERAPRSLALHVRGLVWHFCSAQPTHAFPRRRLAEGKKKVQKIKKGNREKGRKKMQTGRQRGVPVAAVGGAAAAGAALGALIGGALGFMRHAQLEKARRQGHQQQQHQQQRGQVARRLQSAADGRGFLAALFGKREAAVDLGYDWPNVLTDYDLMCIMDRLRTFRHASEQHYKAVGDGCDDIVGVFRLIHDPTVPTQAAWAAKICQYKRRVETALGSLSDAVLNGRYGREVGHGRASPTGEPDPTRGGENVNLHEFDLCADTIHRIVGNYYASAVRSVTMGTAAGPVAMGAHTVEGRDLNNLVAMENRYRKENPDRNPSSALSRRAGTAGPGAAPNESCDSTTDDDEEESYESGSEAFSDDDDDDDDEGE